MAWSKDEVDQFLGGNKTTDELLNQGTSSTHQVDTYSSVSSPSFVIPKYQTPEKDNPDRYKITPYKFQDTESVETLRDYGKKYQRSKIRTFIFVFLCIFSIVIMVCTGIDFLSYVFVFWLLAVFFNVMCGTLEIKKKANVYFKQIIVRTELKQHLIIDMIEDPPIELISSRPVSQNIIDLFECSSNEKLPAYLNLGGSLYNGGEINDLFRGRTGDARFIFMECELRYTRYTPKSGNNKNPAIATLFKGQCCIFQTSVPIPFPVQYDYIPIDNSINPGTEATKDFYKLFRCYQYQPETDIYAGLVISNNFELDIYDKINQLKKTTLNNIANDKANNPELANRIKSYFIQLDNIPQNFKTDLSESDQEIMDTIESEEFQNTLLGIAQIHNNTRWSIRLIENNLIFIRPNCDTFEFDVSDKDIDGQIVNLEHDVSDLIGIIEILSKLPVVRGHLEN